MKIKTTTATPTRDTNRAYRRKMNKRKRPAKMTAADLINDAAVPLNVRHWLERFVADGNRALDHSFVGQDSNVLEQARLIYDVMDSPGKETGASEFPEEARDYVQEYLYRLCEASDIHIWNDVDAAIAVLPALLECSSGSLTDGDSNFIALDAAVKRLTTRQERGEFLTGGRYSAETAEARDIEAAFKLARVLADPTTTQETCEQLMHAVREFSMSSDVTVEHPALVKRTFLLMCEARPKGNVRACRADRRRVLDLLDSLPEPVKGGDA